MEDGTAMFPKTKEGPESSNVSIPMEEGIRGLVESSENRPAAWVHSELLSPSPQPQIQKRGGVPLDMG